jgi:TUTase nucleotidyltransferase domain
MPAQWVEHIPTNIRIFPTNICIFASWYYADGFRGCLIRMLPDVRWVGFLPPYLSLSMFKVDWRIRPLVLCIKDWAKASDINDAKNQTLSSYTLTLMVIHFLQAGVNPPVLPSLQVLYPSTFAAFPGTSSISFFQDLPTRFRCSNIMSLGKVGFQPQCENSLSVCLSFRLFVCLSGRLFVCLSGDSACMYVWTSVCLSGRLLVCLSGHLFVCLSGHLFLSIRMSVCVCLDVCLSVQTSVFLSVRASACPSIRLANAFCLVPQNIGFSFR